LKIPGIRIRNPDSGLIIPPIPTLLRLQRIRVCAGQLLAQAAAGLLRGQKVAGW
jgi:hypothetical protein